MLPGQVYDRFSPLWWFPDVPKAAIGSMRKLENVLPFLRQASSVYLNPLMTMSLHAQRRFPATAC